LTRMENKEWKRGLKKLENQWLYISRGIGSTMKFRWFSRPEITLITWEEGK
jgi:predicted MPP superfamily phosphohydrolase